MNKAGFTNLKSITFDLQHANINSDRRFADITMGFGVS